MKDEITVKETFEERLKERIKGDIGDLIPDELLSSMVSNSINDILVKPRETKNSYGGVIDSKPGLLEEITRDLLTEQIKEYIIKNEELNKLISDAIESKINDAVCHLGTSIMDQCIGSIKHNVDFMITNAFNNHNHTLNSSY